MSIDPDSDLGRFMSLIKGLVFAAVLFVAFGFFLIKMDDQRQVADAENQQHWEKQVAEAIASKRILVGMSEAEAVASWGTPWKHATTSDGGTDIKVWDYADRFLYLKDGYVVRWTVVEN